MAQSRKAIIKSEVGGTTVSKTFTVAMSTAITIGELQTLGEKYVALTTGQPETVTDRITTETTASIAD